ncbi:hypothetical protein Poli38472_008933 [Pythium oligandrum]|uniref:Uncharacterized protein n=1 Tax=Pythium oligandrum TaxID=41045 RepID=A0A8K1C4K5_PYTOL|nr:hypothetical protein Poli38472_008933 [Pythium oligandrum]|eukprot:TMW56285.1 hypothetical protein Poli38472_008933 [Pythium oligandrum]
MELYRSLKPALVLCQPCKDSDVHAGDMEALVESGDDDGGTLLVRDVCAAQGCPDLQLRGHFCRDHALDFELAWKPVRVCNGCGQNVLKIYNAQQSVWFILAPNEENRDAFGVERRWVDKAETVPVIFHAPERFKQLKTNRKRMRRSARHVRQAREKERQRALEWSLGNIPNKVLYLWKENKRRKEAEMNPIESTTAVHAARPPRVWPEPDSVFCSVHGCPRFAKTGRTCLFHAVRSTAPHVVISAALASS